LKGGERKERHSNNLRQEILTAALDIFATEGYQQLSVRRLAEKIGYSPTSIYLHFKDKAELFECVCEQTFGQLSTIFQAIVGRSQTPIEALRQSCRAYVDFGLKHPEQYTVAFMLDSGQRPAASEILLKFPTAMTAFEQLRTGVNACMLSGDFPISDPEIISQIIWAGLHGITALLVVKPSFPWRDGSRLIDLVIATMLAGLKTTAPETLPHFAVPQHAPSELQAGPPAESPVLERRLAKVLEAIADDPRRDIAALASMVNLTPSRLQHLFKQHLKVCIRDFTMRQRLQKAVRLLASTDMRIKEITYEVGYSHCSSFVRAFRRQFLQSPESYRRNGGLCATAQSANQ
jgi:AraC-like DNA-binding protein